MAFRINVGCGQTPTGGWRNFDNSLSLRLSIIPFLPQLLRCLGLISQPQYQFIRFASVNDIVYGDVIKGLPLRDQSVDVLYSSHMLEHIAKNDVEDFLKEALRVLSPGGKIRLVVPDIRKKVQQYFESGDADAFMESTHLCEERPKSFAQRLQHIFVGSRNHQWMYDGKSLTRLLERVGFVKAEEMPVGQTKILNPGPLDLRERFEESVYVEAEKPASQHAVHGMRLAK